jgi:hypothetical protein
MPIGGSGSVIANAAARKRQLANVRTALLDKRGTNRRGGPPPPTAPAQDRTSPQEQALAQERNIPLKIQPEGAPAQQPGTDKPARLFDDDTRARLLQQIEPFLIEQKKQKLAQRHRRVGRVRRFWGGGL